MNDRRFYFESEAPIGIDAFASLKAEDEVWLSRCFVPPDDFELMGDMRSIVVFGEQGTGKSAVKETLIRQCFDSSGTPRCLIAQWQPMPPTLDSLAGFQSVPGQMAYVFDACASAILDHLLQYPNVWEGASKWVQRLLRWFIRRFLQGDMEGRVSLLLERRSGPGADILRELMASERGGDLLPPQNWPIVADELSKALGQRGLCGLWVVVDGMEPWVRAQPTQIAASLGAFFSTLPLFERANFAYKAFLPHRLQPLLASAAGLERHRVHPHRLRWREEELIEIVQQRLALAFGDPSFGMDDLYAGDGLLDWLRRGGGRQPRAWLELLRPLVVYYAGQDHLSPIGQERWRQMRKETLPRLFVDEENRRVVVGGREVSVKEMTSGGYRLLRYLYQRAGQLVSWKELYYRGYRGLDEVPRWHGDDGYEDWSSCEGTLHTRMSDLRGAIELDPRDPLYLETVKGSGVILRLPW